MQRVKWSVLSSVCRLSVTNIFKYQIINQVRNFVICNMLQSTVFLTLLICSSLSSILKYCIYLIIGLGARWTCTVILFSPICRCEHLRTRLLSAHVWGKYYMNALWHPVYQSWSLIHFQSWYSWAPSSPHRMVKHQWSSFAVQILYVAVLENCTTSLLCSYRTRRLYMYLKYQRAYIIP